MAEIKLQPVIINFFPFAAYSILLSEELPKAEGEAVSFRASPC